VLAINGKGNGFSGEALISGGKVIGINVLNEGAGYTNTTKIEFVPLDTGFGAKAMAFISNGIITNIGITSHGSGYKVPPNVWINGGSGSGCRAEAIIEDGKVVNINILDGGSGYTYSPNVKIEPREAKFGCNYCHMCCKKQTQKSVSKETESALEKRLNRQEDLIQKLLNHTHDIPVVNGMKPNVDNRSIPDSLKAKQKQVEEQSIPSIKPPTKPVVKPDIQIINDTVQVKEEKGVSKDWAKTGTAKQSSTEYDASIAISGNKKTFSSTQMKENSYWEIELKQQIELEEIVVQFNLLDNREITVEVSLENQNGAIVQDDKRVIKFNKNEYRQQYNQSILVKKCRISVLAPVITKLAIYDVKMIGLKAQLCTYYKSKYDDQIQDNLSKIVDNRYDTLNAEQTKKLKRQYDTCIDTKKADNETLAKRAELIKKQSAEFKKMTEQVIEEKKKKADEAKQKLVVISKQLLKDEELALEAKKLGVKAPPPMHTKKEIDELREVANWSEKKLRNMSDEDAAKCMVLFNNYKSKKDNATIAGERAVNEPAFIDEAQQNGIEAEAIYNEYTAKCT
jgi:hypothetical protein